MLGNSLDEIYVGDEFASPEPFRSELSLHGTGHLHLEPGARLERIPRQESTDIGFRIDRGRSILSRTESSTENLVVNLSVFGKDWIVTLLEPGTRAAFEVILPEPNGPPGNMALSAERGGVAAAM